MSDNSTEDIISRNPKTTVLTTLTAGLETAVSHIKDDDYRQIAIPVAPFVALAITILFKTLYKRYKCSRTGKMLKNWIKELEVEIANPSTTALRRKEAKKEVAKYKDELKSVQKDFIGIAFD